MKKLTTYLLLGFFAVMALSFISYADETDEIVELYPYNQQACLEATDGCTETKVGSSNWSWMYYGHRYHVVRGGARYAKDFVDEDSDGFISPLEIGSTLSWNAFGALTINDTDEMVVLSTESGRADITTVVHRIYAYFDEAGVLQMFEDQIHTYYIFNEGDAEEPDWRLATETEIDTYEAADPKPDDMRHTHIRMALDDTHPRGYVLEPLSYIQWTNADVDTAEAPVEDWSTIIPGNPNYVTIPAGWSTFSFSTFDRSTQNPLTHAYLQTLPFAMTDDTVDPMVLEYEHQPAVFNNIQDLDDDLVTPGINIVVDYQEAFDLPTFVTATWKKMFDDGGKIIDETEYLDYEVTISQDGVDLETIAFTEEAGVYTASAPVSSIDSTEFGAGYTATFVVENPKGHVTERVADIVIGVMPPTFSGVDTRYVNEGNFIDVLEGITADDGYGNDLTDSIEVAIPDDLSLYNPRPGTYEIDLEFTHNVFFPGEDSFVTFTTGGDDEEEEEETVVYFDEEEVLNADVGVNELSGILKVWTEVDNFLDAGSAWGSVIIKVGADGTMVERYSRYTWNHTYFDEELEEAVTVVGDADQFAEWQENMTLEEGEFILAAHGSVHAPVLRAAQLAYGDSVELTIGFPDFSYDIVTETSYDLIVDDITPPMALVVNDDFSFEVGQFDSVNQAILSNVVAFDMNDGNDVAMYVSNNGGLSLTDPGTYTVEVTVEDIAGNFATASFDVEVLEATLTEDMIQQMIDDAVEQAINDFRDELDDEEPVDSTGCNGAHVTAARYSTMILPLLGMITLIGVIVFKKRF